MPVKKTLQTAGVTLLCAAVLLLVGALLFLGAWALLPDRTGEIHSYDAPSLPEETGATELYPWDRMTTPWTEAVGSLDEEELFGLLSPFLPPQLIPYATNLNEIEFLCDETQTFFGFRNAEIWMRSGTTLIEERDGRKEVITDTESILQYRFSLALRVRPYGSAEICFVSLQPPPRENDLPAAEEAGLNALNKWIETRDLNIDSGSPFAAFIWQYVDFCVMADYVYDPAVQLFGTGACEITLEDHIVYCTVKGAEGEMILLCDPISQTVYGISIQRDN